MNTTLKIGGGVVAACTACCAFSIVPALVAGTSLAALGSAAWMWGGGLAALVAIAVGGTLYLGQRKASSTSANFRANTRIASARGESCGCGPSGKDDTPTACTLGAGDFNERTAEIRDLARRALRDAKRAPLTLTLTYAPEAAEEVRILMTKEQECCPFLAFELKQTAASVELVVVAPPSAREAADVLFDHFAPELATSKNKETV
jgi:hypothetical protein